MKKFEGVLICTDLDGTLLRNDKTISRKNLEAIEYFKSEGGLFTFITGRLPCFSGKICEAIHPNAPFGCINGGGIYDYYEKKYLWQRELDPLAVDLAEYVNNNIENMGVQLNAFERVYFCTENRAMVNFRERTGLPDLRCGIREVKEPLCKIIFVTDEPHKISRAAELLARHPDGDKFDYIHSEAHIYEILPKGSGKGSLLTRMAGILGIDMKKTVALGDFYNDVSMISAAGVGVAVANAVDEAKAAADIVTVSNEEHAVAKVISDIENGIIKL